MGETQDRPFQFSFNCSLKVDFQGARVTSEGGLIVVRELDERLGLSELMDRHLSDPRRGKNIQLPLADLLRQSIYSRLAGYEDVNDAARLSQDPTFRLIGSRKIWERGTALTSRLQSFETEVLTQEENLAGLAALNRELIARAAAIASPRRAVLDMDSTEVRVHGRQEQSAYNGHFESTCYHPLLLFNREGDCLAANEALEEREVKYAVRLPANHLQPSGARQTGNRPLPALLENHAEQNRLKPCRGKPFDLWKDLKFESQKGDSHLIKGGPPSDFQRRISRSQRFSGIPSVSSAALNAPKRLRSPRTIRSIQDKPVKTNILIYEQGL